VKNYYEIGSPEEKLVRPFQEEIRRLKAERPELDSADKRVLEFRMKYCSQWRERGDLYWWWRMMQEVIELTFSLLGLHGDDPKWELAQIASICTNWLEKKGG